MNGASIVYVCVSQGNHPFIRFEIDFIMNAGLDFCNQIADVLWKPKPEY